MLIPVGFLVLVALGTGRHADFVQALLASGFTASGRLETTNTRLLFDN